MIKFCLSVYLRVCLSVYLCVCLPQPVIYEGRLNRHLYTPCVVAYTSRSTEILIIRPVSLSTLDSVGVPGRGRVPRILRPQSSCYVILLSMVSYNTTAERECYPLSMSLQKPVHEYSRATSGQDEWVRRQQTLAKLWCGVQWTDTDFKTKINKAIRITYT